MKKILIIEDERDIYELGFDEYIGNPNGVCCVEWYSQTPQLFKDKKCIHIELIKISDNKRKIIVEEIKWTN